MWPLLFKIHFVSISSFCISRSVDQFKFLFYNCICLSSKVEKWKIGNSLSEPYFGCVMCNRRAKQYIGWTDSELDRNLSTQYWLCTTWRSQLPKRELHKAKSPYGKTKLGLPSQMGEVADTGKVRPLSQRKHYFRHPTWSPTRKRTTQFKVDLLNRNAKDWLETDNWKGIAKAAVNDNEKLRSCAVMNLGTKQIEKPFRCYTSVLEKKEDKFMKPQPTSRDG